MTPPLLQQRRPPAQEERTMDGAWIKLISGRSFLIQSRSEQIPFGSEGGAG